MLRDALGAARPRGFPKTSGSKGIQVYVPLNIDDVDLRRTPSRSRRRWRATSRRSTRSWSCRQKKELRKGKVLIDWSQNDEHKTTVGVYSLRARERPTVSTPLDWDELEARPGRTLVFEAAEVLERVEERGDLFAPVAELEQELPDL